MTGNVAGSEIVRSDKWQRTLDFNTGVRNNDM
jgi:hypothetical protein